MWAKSLFFVVLVSLARVGCADFDSASNAYRNQNYALAFSEFSALVEAGDARAQTVLAIMHKYGEGTVIDLPLAFGWYMKAAVQGYPPAQYNVGVMLTNGSGTPEDIEQASVWLTKAAEEGYDRAKLKMAEIAGETTFNIKDEEPIAWSQSWNLRLPNNIRFDEPSPVNEGLKVYRVQMGAMSSLDRSQHLWQQILAGNEDLFDAYPPIFRQGSSAGKTIFRVQVGPFDNKVNAARFCQVFSDRKNKAMGCLVVFTD